MFIYILTSENEHFIVDEGLSPSVATRLCKRYNETWVCKSSDLRLKCVKGYCVSDRDDLTLAQVKRLVKDQISTK